MIIITIGEKNMLNKINQTHVPSVNVDIEYIDNQKSIEIVSVG